jgi:hypothetical protein
MSIRTVHMDFAYGGAFREALAEAYERWSHAYWRGHAVHA